MLHRYYHRCPSGTTCIHLSLRHHRRPALAHVMTMGRTDIPARPRPSETSIDVASQLATEASGAKRCWQHLGGAGPRVRTFVLLTCRTYNQLSTPRSTFITPPVSPVASPMPMLKPSHTPRLTLLHNYEDSRTHAATTTGIAQHTATPPMPYPIIVAQCLHHLTNRTQTQQIHVTRQQDHSIYAWHQLACSAHTPHHPKHHRI
jgi:hypothetical protein